MIKFCMNIETPAAVDTTNDQTEYFETKGREYWFPNNTDLCSITCLE